MHKAPMPEPHVTTARRFLADDIAGALADVDDAGRRITHAGLDGASRLALKVALDAAWQALTTAHHITREDTP